MHWMVRAGSGVAPWSLLLADGLSCGLVAKAVRPALPGLKGHAPDADVCLRHQPRGG